MARFTWRHSLKVIFVMGWSDFVLKYRGSFFGYLWSLMGPLVKFLVILYVFGPYVSPEIPAYPLYLFLGVILWEHFVTTTTACINALAEKAGIIQKLIFPRILLMFTAGWTNMIIFGTHFFIFFLFAALIGVQPSLHQLLFLVVLIQMFLIAVGVGMLLASYSLRYRDIPHLWGIFSSLLFWLTPIMYQIRSEHPLSQQFVALFQTGIHVTLFTIFDLFVRFQPLSILVDDARRILLYPDRLGIPSITHFFWFSLICLAIFSAGIVVFLRRSRYFVQEY